MKFHLCQFLDLWHFGYYNKEIYTSIQGPVRGDFFWGFGEEALHWAGRMKQTGRYYILLPKSVAERRASTS